VVAIVVVGTCSHIGHIGLACGDGGLGPFATADGASGGTGTGSSATFIVQQQWQKYQYSWQQ